VHSAASCEIFNQNKEGGMIFWLSKNIELFVVPVSIICEGQIAACLLQIRIYQKN
jgi:hypothetical protein